jgi:hypothetical protein
MRRQPLGEEAVVQDLSGQHVQQAFASIHGAYDRSVSDDPISVGRQVYNDGAGVRPLGLAVTP